MTKIIYPQTKKELVLKYKYYIENEQNIRRIEEIQKWYDWYKRAENKLNYTCKKNEFLMWTISDSVFAVGIWVHNEKYNYDELTRHLIASGESLYSTDETIIVN